MCKGLLLNKISHTTSNFSRIKIAISRDRGNNIVLLRYRMGVSPTILLLSYFKGRPRIAELLIQTKVKIGGISSTQNK